MNHMLRVTITNTVRLSSDENSRGCQMEAAIRSQELNPGRMTSLFKKQFELCKVKPGETIAIVSDLGTRREYIQAAFAAADEIGMYLQVELPHWSLKVGEYQSVLT